MALPIIVEARVTASTGLRWHHIVECACRHGVYHVDTVATSLEIFEAASCVAGESLFRCVYLIS